MPYKNKEDQRRNQRDSIRKRRTQYITLLGDKCSKCVSSEKLEFHHRDRQTKLSHKFWSWGARKREAELAKCDLLCSECHKKETAKERGYGIYTHGTLTAYKSGWCRCDKCRAANAAWKREGLRTSTVIGSVTGPDFDVGRSTKKHSMSNGRSNV